MLLNITDCLLCTHTLLTSSKTSIIIHDVDKEAIATQHSLAWFLVGLFPTIAFLGFLPKFLSLQKRLPAVTSLCAMVPGPVTADHSSLPNYAGRLFISRLENSIFNKSNIKEVLSMRKSGDNDLLLLLLFPAQMVLQMKWIKIGSSLWLVTGADLAPPVGSHQTHSTPPAQELPTGTCVLWQFRKLSSE